MVLMTLGILAELFWSYSQAVRTAASKNRTLCALQIGLSTVRNELREAIQVDQPGAGGSTHELKFSKIDPTISRFPGPGPLWNPFLPAHIERLRYFLFDDQLKREVIFADGTQRQSILLQPVSDFTVARGSVEDYEIAVTIPEDRRQRRVVTQVVR